GMASRIAHNIEFPDYGADELMDIAKCMMTKMQYRFDLPAETAMREYIERRMGQPRFSNARSIRNALDRARLRHANRLFSEAAHNAAPDRDALMRIAAEDIRASGVFRGGLDGEAAR